MRSMHQITKSVYLHFLNREDAFYARTARTEAFDISCLFVLLACHCKGLTANIAPITAYTAEKPTLRKLVLSLSGRGILSLSSSEPDLNSFIESRRLMYKQLKDKFQIYFEDTHRISKFKVDVQNPYSMTSHIRGQLAGYDPLRSDHRLAVLPKRNVASFERRLDQVREVSHKNRDLAITVENIVAVGAPFKFSPDEQVGIASVLSSFYNEKYQREHDAVAATGVKFASSTSLGEKLFPHYDVIVLTRLLVELGWATLLRHNASPYRELLEFYGSQEHKNFVRILHTFLEAVWEQIRLNGTLKGNDPNTNRERTLIHEQSLRILNAVNPIEVQSSTHHFFTKASNRILDAGHYEAQKSSLFKYAWELNGAEMDNQKGVILTATDTEDDVIREFLTRLGYERQGVVAAGEAFAERYSVPFGGRLFHLRTGAGSLGTSGSELAVADAIRTITPDFIIAYGICFGLKKEKSELIDVLISSQVVDYETVRLQSPSVIERGDRIPVGTRLVSAGRIARGALSSRPYEVKVGQLVSGLKLLDKEEVVNELENRFPDAIGGEMEATGLMAAATRHGCKEWIVVKAICDWGYGKSDSVQVKAAKNAAEVTTTILETMFNTQN